jgi:hypothetical protein
MRRGPITCTMTMTPALARDYTGGVYSEKADGGGSDGTGTGTKHTSGSDATDSTPAANHTVVLSGWGYDESSSRRYWVGGKAYSHNPIHACTHAPMAHAPVHSLYIHSYTLFRLSVPISVAGGGRTGGSASRCTPTTWELRGTAHGQCPCSRLPG